MIAQIVVLAGLVAQSADADRLSPLLRRLSDPVAFLDGRLRREELLAYFDKSRRLAPGDGLRSGPAGSAEIHFPRDGALVELRGAWRLRLVEESEEAVLLDCAEAARGRVRAGRRTLRMRIAGYGELAANDASFRIGRDDLGGVLEVRNAGPGVLSIRSASVPGGRLDVGPGEVAQVPRSEGARPAAAGRLVFSGRPVETYGAALADVRDGRLVLSGPGEALVAGAQLRLGAGGAVEVVKPPQGGSE